jgi:hypothetical protein
MANKLKISDFRAAVRTVNYVRNDFYGHVEHERLRTNLRQRFERSTGLLSELVPLVHKRFSADIADAQWALDKANEQVLQNEADQRAAIKSGVRGEIYNPDNVTNLH